MKHLRMKRLPERIRREIRSVRRERGWSQLELGRRAGLTQRHVSGIETGRIVPRYDTLMDLLRVLDRDLVLVPAALVPIVHSLVRDYGTRHPSGAVGDRPLYAVTDGDGDGDGDEDDDGRDGETYYPPEHGG